MVPVNLRVESSGFHAVPLVCLDKCPPAGKGPLEPVLLDPNYALALLSLDRNAMASQTDQDYFRSVNSESKAYMMVSANGRRDATSKLWVPMVVTVIVVLQIASTTGLFVYLNMSISEVRSFQKVCV